MALSTKPKSKQILMRENRCNSATPMTIKNYLRKTFADILATELEERIIQAICGPRSKQKVDVAQRLLKLFVDVTGEQCTLQTPKSGTQRILVFIADQMAVWMIDAVDAADKAVVDRKEKVLQGIEDGGKGDANKEEEEDDKDEADVEIIHKKKRPKKVSRGGEGAGDGAGEPRFEGGKKPAAAKKIGAEGSNASSTKGTKSESSAKRKKPSTDEGGEKSGQTKSARSQPQRKEGSKKDEGEKKPKTGSQGQSRQSKADGKGSADQSASAQAKGSTSAQAKGSTSAQAKGSTSDKPASRPSRAADDASKSSAKPGAAESSQSRPNVPPRRPSQTSSKQDISKSAAPAKTSTSRLSKSESRPAAGAKRGSKSSDQRPRTASEIQKEKIGEVLSAHISSLIKEGSTRDTPRAAALRDVISKKLEGSGLALDQKGMDTIKAASVLLAAYIDKQAETVELEYGTAPPPKPFAQKGKGPVFSVKKAESSLAIREITHTEAAAKIASARGRPTPGTVTLSKGGFTSKETQEWAKWASEVANMADKWSKWIESTVSITVTSAKTKKAGQEVPEWPDWKEQIGDEALEWRRNKKLLNQSAAFFQDKLDHTNKPPSAPAPGSPEPI